MFIVVDHLLIWPYFLIVTSRLSFNCFLNFQFEIRIDSSLELHRDRVNPQVNQSSASNPKVTHELYRRNLCKRSGSQFIRLVTKSCRISYRNLIVNNIRKAGFFSQLHIFHLFSQHLFIFQSNSKSHFLKIFGLFGKKTGED